MPTTFRNLFPQICGFAPLLEAYRRARRGKRSRPDVAAFEFRYEEHLHQLAEELADGRYVPGAYRSFRITENGKARTISAAPFRDRVVHHALCAVLEPIWEPRFIHDSYASRPGKGTHAALDRAQHFARGHRYALPLDVQQFFPAIDHALGNNPNNRNNNQGFRLVDSVAILNSVGALGMEPLSTTLFTALGAAIGAVLGGTAQAAGEDAWKSVRDKLARLARPQEQAQAQAFEAAVRQALAAFRRLYPDDPAARQALALLREHAPLREAALDALLLRAQPDLGRLLDLYRRELRFQGLLRHEVASDRWTIVRCLEAFVRRWEPFGNRFIATSRIAGYDEAPLDASLFVRATIQPFDDDDIRRFLRQWSYAYERADPSRTSEAVADAAARRAEALTEAVFASENVQALARNPLLLTIIALIHQQGTRLPDRRVDLYRLCVETLAETWNRARSLSDRPINVYLRDEKLDERRVVNLLGPVALWVHQEQPGGLVEQADLEHQLAQTLQQSDGLPFGKAQRLAGDFVKLVREHTGLLQERGQRQFGFLHLTFEEYLAARAVVESAFVQGDELIHQYATDPRWREVLRLALANTNQREAQRLLLHLLDAPAEGEARGLPVVLAGECLLDLGRHGATPQAWEVVITRLLALLEDLHARFATRVAGGRVLGLLGDPRLLDPRTGDAPVRGYWCPIEAGPFWFGDDTEEELQQIEQPYPFKIARFAVTNAEYRRFVEADGYNPDQLWWTAEGRKWLLPGGHRVSWEDNNQPITQPWSWNQERYNHPSQPMVGVSWYEAAAYAAWLTLQGHTHGWLPPEAVIRLPTWCEWQRAARHTDRRRYPWGDAVPSPEHANYDETGLGTTAPVGCFSAGQAACGAFDLAGNVWEWMATHSGAPDEAQPLVDVKQRKGVFVAGGPFPNGNERLCCGARDWFNPFVRDFNLGFRVDWSLRSLV